ncbi:hypothetical protein L6452_05944 [Arctium lappa]|uniref:Uncharacterized protein n=1 Tax=Arctium lappa TaxID=4217 RepID=A0ACB9EIH2_ARCLA|nr:hypothetical protein L6452_05944 [Arctium lappa]
MPPIFTGEVELGPRVDLASTSPVIQVANPQADMMANVMQMENVLVGSRGTGNRVRTEENRVVTAPRSGKSCSYKSFLGCRPPEFSGSEDPVAFVKWIRAVEQAFGSSECGDGQRGKVRNATAQGYDADVEYCNERAMDRIEAEFQALEKGNLTVREYTRQFMEKLGLVGHVASTEKEKIKAYLKGLLSDMMTMVRNSKASNLRETIEEAQFMEEVYARGKPEKAVAVVEKRKWENSSVPHKRTRPFVGNRRFNSYQEARWCQNCRTKHHGNCSTTPQPCNKCGKSDHNTRDCPIKGLVCFECKAPGHMRKYCPKLMSGSAPVKKENPSRVPGRAFQMTADEAKASADVVSGTFLINSVPARVLFDTGVSFSFISELFRPNIFMPTTSLEDALVVKIANGSQVLIRDVLKK